MEGLRKSESPMFIGTATIAAQEYRGLIEEATMCRAQMDEISKARGELASLRIENESLKTELEKANGDKNTYHDWWFSELGEANKAKEKLAETEKKLSYYTEFIDGLGSMVNFEAWMKEKDDGNKDND